MTHRLTDSEARVVARVLYAIHERDARHERGDHDSCLPHVCEVAAARAGSDTCFCCHKPVRQKDES